MSRRYPVITGIGVLSPIGNGRQAFADALLAGRSGVRARPLGPGDPLPCTVHAPVEGFDPRSLPGQRKNLKVMSRAVQLGLGAAFQALTDAGIEPGSVTPRRFGAYVGAGQGSSGVGADLEPALGRAFAEDGFSLRRFAQAGLPEINPLWLIKGLSNNVLAFVSAHYRMMGPNLNLCNSGVSGLQAIGEAAHAIRAGRAEVCLAGGYDSLVQLESLALFARLGLLSPNPDPATASRPFHPARDGFVPAEGAAFVVIEERERAEARGAKIWAQVLGYGSANGAFDLAGPQPDGAGLATAASQALRTAGVPPVDIGCVVAHASGSVLYDAVEAATLSRLLGPARDRIPVLAPKSVLGHTVAASGALGALSLLVTLDSRQLPPTATLDEVAPECRLKHVRTAGQRFERAPHGLVMAAGLGGQHAALVLGEEPY